MFARRSLLYALIGLSLLVSPALSEIITVPNGSFESPYVDMVSPYATSDIADWQKAPAPAWWLGAGYSAKQWTESAGTFVNVPFAPIDNIDGRQGAFMFSPPGYELFQDLTATFSVGKSYHLTVGIQGGGYGMAVGTPMEIRLYYRDANSNRITIGATEVKNINGTGSLTHLTDYQLDIAAVAAGDTWAGQNIGIQLIATGQASGYWDLDNVRLTAAVPEPSSITLLAIGLVVLAVRSRTVKK